MKNTSGRQSYAAFDERYARLNSAQKKAVDTIEGPLLVVAGPGSGKTEILSLRVANILRQTQALPSNILCLTFTESAALNMRERLSRLMGQEAYRVAIHTFHNFCVNIIQKYPEFFYSGAMFNAADPLAQIAILEDIFEVLPHDNPLRSIHPEQGYVYLSAVSKAIGNLKKSGLRPDEFLQLVLRNEKELLFINEVLAPLFDAHLSKKKFDEVETAIIKLESKINRDIFHSLTEVVATSLAGALAAAREVDETKPLSVWKEKMMKRSDDGNRVFKDTLNLQKMKSLADIYSTYRSQMHIRCMYDFDDMILDTIAAIEEFPRLKYELQEQYQYMLVDEFQDTNDAQMRLLRLIADAPVNEGHPNIMVVGDDDQAVYKFQGAELSNILDFRTIYSDVALVTMTANYRSTQDILDVASHIIRKGENRLENLLPEMEKKLVASHPDLKVLKGDAKNTQGIVHRTYQSSLHEYHFVSREIRRLIDAGTNPEGIAVIARKHSQLEMLVPYLQGVSVPIRYEREQNVFLEPHIHQLTVMARFIASLGNHSRAEADEYLPEILSYPFWNLPRKALWEVSAAAGRGERDGNDSWRPRPWISVMTDHADKQVRAVGNFLLELGNKSAHEPLESMLDMMIGAHVVLASESEDEDDTSEIFGTTTPPYAFVSPFKEYYFNKERFEHSQAEYLSFLSSLRVFVRALREYKGRHAPHELLMLRDLVEFVDLHTKNNIALNDKSPFGSVGKSVHLLSAHKAKGLEFDTVFVLSCQDEIWAGRGMGNKLSFPLNLQIDPAGDTQDDQLRLFYVALTRAKRHLYLTSYDKRDDGEPSSTLRFLVPGENETNILKTVGSVAQTDASTNSEADTESVPETHELLTASWLRYHTPPFLGEEQQLLQSLLENYQLSVTHLNNFLNVGKGGPQVFLEQNLLRFPQAKTPSGAFGSAVHRAIEKMSVELRRTGNLCSENELLEWFSEYLRRERLSKTDFDLYNNRGSTALTLFYKAKHSTFNASDKTEVNFCDQGVVIDIRGGLEAHLAGKIDRIVDKGGGVFEVHDYKTGKAKDEWLGKDVYEKVKLHEYRRQLAFYKILVERSRDFGGTHHVDRGILEFVEPLRDKRIVDLALDIPQEEVLRLESLIRIAYAKIMDLDFPDTSAYSDDLNGIIAFEDYLLNCSINDRKEA